MQLSNNECVAILVGYLTFASIPPQAVSKPPIASLEIFQSVSSEQRMAVRNGLTAVTTQDGRFTALMPHPERVFRNVQMSWSGGNIDEHSPWMQMWRNAREWVA